MNWGSLSEFLAMGGYGLYVWGSYGVVLRVSKYLCVNNRIYHFNFKAAIL